MTKEERRQKFLLEHPKFSEWQTPRKLVNFFGDIPLKVKTKARQTVNIETRARRLKREKCNNCDITKTQAHHEDYTKPLEVLWLCAKHHKELHSKLNHYITKKLSTVDKQNEEEVLLS